MQCHCNSNKPFDTCCLPILLGKQKAETAEQLMRSRYSAYVLADVNYLLNSYHPSTRPTKQRKSIFKWAKSVKWVRLEVLNIKDGLKDNKDGFVEFKAFFMENGKLELIHENSYFVNENNRWFYKSGVHK